MREGQENSKKKSEGSIAFQNYNKKRDRAKLSFYIFERLSDSFLQLKR